MHAFCPLRTGDSGRGKDSRDLGLKLVLGVGGMFPGSFWFLEDFICSADPGDVVGHLLDTLRGTLSFSTRFVGRNMPDPSALVLKY